ncbi:ATP-grasp domain-containing protein [Candidatus Gracilibacteria bacterium]|nr:ATP-grasp domain-containing protein [Candidatus Gracilibacteria bacterium]MCF7856072.1 ATP-grasp domain-containing protein [Candidatus Gracilibacteria bacterium]MCF7896491.1 ATP-grasp domain-containing protein [Candidatus Gracilibacteria bacterium]
MESAQKAGFAAVLVTRKIRNGATKVFDKIFEVDLNQKEVWDALAKTLKVEYNVKAVVSNYDHFVVQRSYLAERLGVPATTVYSAACTRNKVLMRKALAVIPENIEFEEAQTLAEAKKVRKRLGGDVFLKSIAGIKSRCIFHVQSEAQLTKAWKEFRQLKMDLDTELYDDFKYLDFRFNYPNPRETVLVEKAIEGKQVTVSSLVDSHRVWHAPSLCDIYTAADIGREDSFLAFRMLPSKQPKAIWQEAKKITTTAINVLGLRNCAVFTDLIVDSAGNVKIIEIASRMGGYRPLMYQHAYGFYLPDLLIRAVTGRPVKRRKKAQQYVSLLELFPSEKGKFVKIENLKELQKDPALVYSKMKAKRNQIVGKARENFEPVAVILLKGKNYKELKKKSFYYQERLKVLVT